MSRLTRPARFLESVWHAVPRLGSQWQVGPLVHEIGRAYDVHAGVGEASVGRIGLLRVVGDARDDDRRGAVFEEVDLPG